MDSTVHFNKPPIQWSTLEGDTEESRLAGLENSFQQIEDQPTVGISITRSRPTQILY